MSSGFGEVNLCSLPPPLPKDPRFLQLVRIEGPVMVQNFTSRDASRSDHHIPATCPAILANPPISSRTQPVGLRQAAHGESVPLEESVTVFLVSAIREITYWPESHFRLFSSHIRLPPVPWPGRPHSCSLAAPTEQLSGPAAHRRDKRRFA